MPVVKEELRKLATHEVIRSLRPIEGADAIEQAQVRNWTLVVKRGEVAVGDPVVFFEVDTALPVADPRFAFLAPRGVKTDEGQDFHVLKTARLRGVYSQGLVLPLLAFQAELEAAFPALMASGQLPAVGTNLTEVLGLGKWEAPLTASGGDAKGAFFSGYISKSDAERVQNISASTWDLIQAHEWVATEKIDGTSLTVIRDWSGELHVNSRNLEIQQGDNLYWNVTTKFNLGALLEPGEALQAEVAGEGVQRNRQGVKGGLRPFIFNYVRDRVHVPRAQWPEAVRALSVPELPLELPATPEAALTQVDGMKSTLDTTRLAEGVVWHSADGREFADLGGRSVWKAISGKYLLKD